MRTKYFNKIFLLSIVITTVFTACDIDRSKHEKQCMEDAQIKLYYKKFSILFSHYTDSLSLNTVQLYHIRDGHASKLPYIRNRDYLDVVNVNLLARDTIVVRVLDPKKEFILHDFRNGPRYGGKNFLGCYLFTYKENGRQSSVTSLSVFHIHLNEKSP